MATTRSFSFTTTMRVIDWIHCNTSNFRTTSKPTVNASFSETSVRVIRITNDANCGHASQEDLTLLS